MRWFQRLFAVPTGGERKDDNTPIAGANPNDSAQCPAPGFEERDRLIAAATGHDAGGRYSESLALLGPALAAAPDDPELLFANASTLYDWGRYREALDAYQRAAALGLGRHALPLQIGWCWFRLEDLEQAETWMRKAVRADPEAVRAHFGLATVLQARNRLDEAIVGYENALERSPDDYNSLAALSSCMLGRGDLAAAEARARRAIAVDRERPLGWVQLAVALERQSRYEEAFEALARAEGTEAGSDENLDSFVSLAIEHKNAGRMQEAIDLLERNLAHRPSPLGHCIYGAVLLSVGRLREGWDHYEFRWLIEPGVSWRLPSRRPVWAGQSLRGKTVLLRVEQGYGDCIQFLRYAPYVKAQGATVLLAVYAGLMGLVADCAGVDRVVDAADPSTDYDFHIHLMSLPRVFGTELGSVPADAPYLHADPRRIEQWADRLPDDGVLNVGIAWAGSTTHLLDRERSMPLARLAPALAVDGARFYTLQKGPAAAQIAGAALEGRAIIDFGAEFDNVVGTAAATKRFVDTAAVISRLDLVLCVDTAVAHLAGAMGKPVWLMLPHAADFRWLQEREDSPWYPTVRLFRQPQRGDWDDVAVRIKSALELRMRGVRAELPPPGEPPAPSAPVPVSRQWPPPGHRPGFSAVAETRTGILQYLPDEAEVGAAVHWYGESLQRQLDLLTRFIRPGMTAMEVEASVGVHALALAEAVGAAGHLFLYESRPIVRRILLQNLTANRVLNATVMRRMLGRTGNAEGLGTGDAAPAPAAPGPITETLDDLQLARLDWLKINDGRIALAVLDGAAATLWRLRPRLFLTADASTLPTLSDRASEFGYRRWRVETPLFNPDNFNRRDDDIFSGGSALALLAIPEEIEVDAAIDGGVEL